MVNIGDDGVELSNNQSIRQLVILATAAVLVTTLVPVESDNANVPFGFTTMPHVFKLDTGPKETKLTLPWGRPLSRKYNDPECVVSIPWSTLMHQAWVGLFERIDSNPCEGPLADAQGAPVISVIGGVNTISALVTWSSKVIIYGVNTEPKNQDVAILLAASPSAVLVVSVL
jgi:hypothetical protein